MVVAGQIDVLRHYDDDDGDRAGAPKAFSRRITKSCSDRIIIMIIMNLWNCLFSVTKTKKFMLLWNPDVS